MAVTEPPDAASTPVPDPQRASEADTAGTPYPHALEVAATVASFDAPVVSALAATGMLATETDPAKRRQLQTWRNTSYVVIAIGAVFAIVAIVVFVAISNNAAACKGGKDPFGPAISYTSSDNVHWTGTFNCVNGGTTTVPVPASEVPGAGQLPGAATTP